MKTHKVLALVATVAVALSGWCYDPPKHTNAYTRAGVTFAQRGGMEASTYVVTNVTMNGNARMLPPYLYELDLDDTYPEDAAWYYAQADYSDGGGCSVRRIGNAIERNFDWKFDAAPTFVVRVKGSDDRFASVAVCNVGTNLTEEMVRSGTPSRFYKCIAGHATDGVNENGVFAEVNVVDGTWPRTSGTVHGLGAVRYAMDHGTNAQQVAEFLAENVYLPEGFGVNFHYLIADETATYIVENGVAHPVTNAPAVMTNFKLYPKTQGAGWERYELLSDTANAITDAWFTRAYAEDTDWISEFDNAAEMETAKELWRNGLKESHRGQHVGNKWWWQSVHTSVYDMKARTLEIAVQEIADWYVFGLPASGSGKVKSVNGKVGEVTLHAEDVGAVPTVITNEVRVQLAEKLDIMPNGSTNGLRLAVGGSGMVANVDGNVSFKVAGERSLSDYGITNAIPQDAADVGALPDDQAQLEANENFRGAVATVSPPVELPTKWAWSNITNANGMTPNYQDVNARPAGWLPNINEIGGVASNYGDSLGQELYMPTFYGEVSIGKVGSQLDTFVYNKNGTFFFDDWGNLRKGNRTNSQSISNYIEEVSSNKLGKPTKVWTEDKTSGYICGNLDVFGAVTVESMLCEYDGGQSVQTAYLTVPPTYRREDSEEEWWFEHNPFGYYGNASFRFRWRDGIWYFDVNDSYTGRYCWNGTKDSAYFGEAYPKIRLTRTTTSAFGLVGKLALTNDLANLVPRTFTINGTPMTGDGITIQGMTQNALVLTNGSVKTYTGASVAPSAIGAMDRPQTVEVVNQTKALFAADNTNLVLRLRTEWTPDGAAVFFDAFTNDVDAVIAR